MRYSAAWLLGLLTAGMVFAAEAENRTEDPYGVCAHVSRAELEIAPQEFRLMRELNSNWARTDFDWKGVESKPGTWDFSRLDRLVSMAKQSEINILPILDYDVPWATPAWKHLDSWGEYVRRVVTRYAKELRCWEAWNEPNGRGFWRDEPDGAHYALLLKRTWEEVKKIDPELTVLYGGTAGIPLDFIEDSLKAGAAGYFDVMNIHPYHWRGVPETMFSRLPELRALMRKHGAGEKPIWITEIGWSTPKPSPIYVDVLPPVLAEIGIDPAASAVAVVNDPDLGFPELQNFDADFHFGMFRKVERIRLSDLKSLNVKQFPVLVPSLSEEFPMCFLPDVIAYVKRGGTLLLPSGLPFYKDFQMDGRGGGRSVQVNDKYLADLHISWEAHWTGKGVPEQEKRQKTASRFSGKFSVDFKPTGRFLTAANLKEGDEFIPVIEAGTDSYTGTVFALYKLNSDLKGNIIVYTGFGTANTVSEKRQAEMLPRTYLLAMANGIERIFWYNLRAGEWKPDEMEHHFGIVHADLTPKSAFCAYRTLTAMCPAGSTVPNISVCGECRLAGWTRPDGVNVWAVWTPRYPEEVKLKIGGKVAEAVNHLGEKQPVPGNRYTATPGILYLVGPESVSIDVR